MIFDFHPNPKAARAVAYVQLQGALLAGDLDPTERSRKEALAYTLALYTPVGRWDLPALLVLAQAIEAEADVYSSGGRLHIRDVDFDALRRVTGSHEVADLALRLAGLRHEGRTYTDKQTWHDDPGIVLTFGATFASDAIEEWAALAAE